MPKTRSQGKKLEQPIDMIERFVSIRRRIREYQIKYNLHDLSLPEPRMVEGPCDTMEELT